MQPTELIAALTEARHSLEAALAGLNEAQLQQPGASGEWSVKDVLTHITAWEAELVTGLAKFRQGARPGKTQYTEAEIQAQNAAWHAENQRRPLERVLADWRGVHKQTLKQVEALSAADLNAPRPWLLKGTLAAWITSWIVEHEHEHAAEISTWRQTLK